MGGVPISRTLLMAALLGASSCIGLCSNAYRYHPALSMDGETVRACHGARFLTQNIVQVICSTFDGEEWVAERVDEGDVDEFGVFQVRGEAYYSRSDRRAGTDTLVHAVRGESAQWTTTPVVSAGMIHLLVGAVTAQGAREVVVTSTEPMQALGGPQVRHFRQASVRWDLVPHQADQLPGTDFFLGGIHALDSGTLELLYGDPALGLVVAENSGGAWNARTNEFLPQVVVPSTARTGGQTFVALAAPEDTLRLGRVAGGAFEELHHQKAFGDTPSGVVLAASASALHLLVCSDDGEVAVIDFDLSGNELRRRDFEVNGKIGPQALVATGSGDDLVFAVTEGATVTAFHRVGGVWTEREIISSGSPHE